MSMEKSVETLSLLAGKLQFPKRAESTKVHSLVAVAYELAVR